MKAKMNTKVLSRLESLTVLKEIPRFEINWLVDHGNIEIYQPGVIAPKGTKIEYLWIILNGRISLHTDSGAGLKVANTELSTGTVTGMLPYSRLKEFPEIFMLMRKPRYYQFLSSIFQK